MHCGLSIIFVGILASRTVTGQFRPGSPLNCSTHTLYNVA